MDTQTTTSDDTGEVLKNLETLIKTTVSSIDRKKEELKKLNEMTVSYLTQDSTYQEQEKTAKEAARVKNATKFQLLKNPTAFQTLQKAKELKTELRETQEGLSEYLREYQRISGSNEIEDEQGEVLTIVYVAKLVKRSSRFT